MGYTTLTYIKADHIARITLNRPEADNVINQQMAQELDEICSSLNQDDSIYLVLITGAGSGAFCGGGEMEWPDVDLTGSLTWTPQ